MQDALRFVLDQSASLFEEGVRALEGAAASGGAGATERLVDLRGASGLARVVLKGRGEAWVRVADGAMVASTERPAHGGRVDLAIGLDAEVADVLLDEALRARPRATREWAMGVASMVSARVQRALAAETLAFTFTVKDTPDFERVVLAIGVGLDAPPEAPRFTVEVKYADLERLERGELRPDQFFMGGKLKFGGDYARALQLAMQIVNPPKKRA